MSSRRDRRDRRDRRALRGEQLLPLWLAFALAFSLICGSTAGAEEAGNAAPSNEEEKPADAPVTQTGGETGEKPAEGAVTDAGADGDKKLIPRHGKPVRFRPKAVRKKIPKLSAAKNEEIEASREALEALIRDHVAHANAGDLDAYLADFRPKHPHIELIAAYAQRVMEEHEPTIEIVELEVQNVNQRTARVRVVQRASYQNETGGAIVDVAEVTYRARRGEAGWRLESTNRARVRGADGDAPGPDEDDEEDEEDDEDVASDED